MSDSSSDRRVPENEERFDLLAAATLDGMYDWDLRSDEVWCNHNFAEAFGAIDTRPVLSWWAERIHPEDRDRALASFDEFCSSGAASFVGEYRFRRLSGEYADIYERGLIVRHSDGTPGRLIGSMVDLTGRVRAEQALRASETALRHSEERFRTLVEKASDMIAILDATGRILYEAPAVERILGYKPEERIGESPFDLVHPADQERVIREFTAALAANADSHRIEFRMRHKDGSWRYIESIGRNLLLHPAVRGIVVNSRDLTERREIEKQLDLAERLSSLGHLAATMAHEFNNVLMGIQPFAEVICRSGAADSSLASAAAYIEKSIQRGRRITQEILRFARPVADPVLSDIDVTSWLREIRSELAALLGSRHELVIDVETGTLIRGDAGQLTQVLTNLVLNARDAMGSDAGRVTIVARKLPVGTSDYFTAPAEEECCITVADTGPGIPPAVAARLFEPLFTTKQSGTGLGLPVARQVVERHRGRICIDSDAERGAVFHIFLPAGSSPQKETPPPASTAAAARSFERRILLVEDDQTVAAGIAAVLEFEGFTAAVVHQAAAAIDTIATFRPDAVVLDVGLPDGDGVELYGLLAARWPDLPVIFSTGHADESRLAGVRHRPHVAFLQKPYTVEALIGELDRLMSVAAN